jgi:hypothetical protein
MVLESLSGGLDPLLWARNPRSQTALDSVRRGSAGNADLLAILQKHIADGICTEDGKLRRRWEGLQWVSV